MLCYQCQTLLLQTKITDKREKKGEIIIRSTCPSCNMIYEAQFVAISMLAQQPGDENSLTIVKHCYHCGQLYPEDQEHSCQAAHK